MARTKIFEKKLSLNCKGKIIDLSAPKIMGIINITPDSFFDGGKYLTDNEIIARITQLIEDGADFIDIGAVSARPGAEMVSQEEEWTRFLPALEMVKKNFENYPFSLDTFRSEIAGRAVSDYGISMINDIS